MHKNKIWPMLWILMTYSLHCGQSLAETFFASDEVSLVSDYVSTKCVEHCTFSVQGNHRTYSVDRLILSTSNTGYLVTINKGVCSDCNMMLLGFDENAVLVPLIKDRDLVIADAYSNGYRDVCVSNLCNSTLRYRWNGRNYVYGDVVPSDASKTVLLPTANVPERAPHEIINGREANSVSEDGPNPTLFTNGDGVMVVVFQVLVNLVLFLASLGQLFLLYLIIVRFTEKDNQEIVMRSSASVCGLLIYLGAKAVGLSLPELMFKAMADSVLVFTGVFGFLVPSLIGFFMAQYVIKFLGSKDARKNKVGVRLLSLVMTLVFFLYTDSYIVSFDTTRRDEFKVLLPNLMFVLSVLLYAIFKYHPENAPDEAQV